jgi:predicted PurR-regulated permease PerM
VISPGRGGVIGVGLSWAARWSARLLLVAAGMWLLGFLVGQLWTVVFPTLLAIVLATVLWPPAAFLRRHRFPPAFAPAVVLIVGIVMIAVLVALVGSAVSGSMPQIVQVSSRAPRRSATGSRARRSTSPRASPTRSSNR